MDTMISFANNDLALKFMTEEEIKKSCPAAFLTEPSRDLSDKYVVATTIDVVRDLAKLGWFPVKASQRKPQKNKSTKFNFHMIAFQNPDVKIVKTVTNPDGTTNEEVDCYPRILVTNSMDGTACFKFMVGCWRLVCSNGLVICTDKFADMKIRHINYSFEDLKALIQKVAEELPGQIEYMNNMQKVVLTEEQQKELALKMYRLRQGTAVDDDSIILDDDAIDDLLTAVRKEDEGSSLWLVWNRLQERLTKGMFSTTDKKGKVRKARAIKSFEKDLKFNKEIWRLAEGYLA